MHQPDLITDLTGEPRAPAADGKLTGYRGPQQGTGEMEWYTPEAILDAAREAMGGIDLDPASSREAQRTVRARRFYTKEENGLAQPWKAKRLWLNPPYNAHLIRAFADKLLASVKAGDVKQAVWLSNASYDTAWGQRLMDRARGFCAIGGRLKFRPGAGQAASSNAWPSMVLYFEDPYGLPYHGRGAFCRAFRPLGVTWTKLL